ncbi:MAG: ectonucleotide pyrophosphatase/phosphodiesterase [Dokdonella sp.]
MKNPLRSVALLCLLLVASCGSQPSRLAKSPVQPLLILVSVDGMHPDYLQRGLTPTLQDLADRGVRAESMRPSFPTLTFPNHYTLVTGLRPDRNGIVNNTMEDARIPDQRFSLSNREAVMDARWWDQAVPLWTSLRRSGQQAATMFWPGSEAPIHGHHPDYWHPFDAKMSTDARVDSVLGWLDLPAAKRPRLMTLYFEGVDSAGHRYGPDSEQVNTELKVVDAAIARLLEGLDKRSLRESVNLVIVSDHGMAATSPERVVYMDDLLPADAARVVVYGVLTAIEPKAGHSQQIEAILLTEHDNMRCWRKSEVPARLHYGSNPRIPSLLCLANDGWTISSHDYVDKAVANSRFSLGQHGYDNEDPSMRALFIAYGPSFRRGLVVPEFDNVDVYPLLARLLAIPEEANDGDYRNVSGFLNTSLPSPAKSPTSAKESAVTR